MVNNVSILEYLLTGDVRCNIADNEGNYPIHYVMQAKTDSVCFILYLLLDHGSFTLLDVANKHKDTPLQALDKAEREYAQESDQAGLGRCS